MFTMNFAEPSGSSAAEKPPAKKMMFAFAILSTIVSTEASIAASSSVTNGVIYRYNTIAELKDSGVTTVGVWNVG